MTFSRDGGAYTIALSLATRLALKDLGFEAAHRKSDQNLALRQFLHGNA
jgi:hypothetical protein